jgi:hypothetical protein
MTISWVKPDGTKVETNDMKATILYCESRDWKQVGATPLDDPQPAEPQAETVEISEADIPENLPMSDPRSTEPEFQQPPDEPEAA